MYQPARYYSPFDALETPSNDGVNAFSLMTELHNGLKTFAQDLQTGFANMIEFYSVLTVQIVRLCFHVGLPPRFDQVKLAYSANLFLACIAPVIWYPNTQSKIVRSGMLLVLKVAAGLAFIGTLLADVYLHKPEAADCTHISFPTISLSIFTALVAVWVQLSTHKRKLGSSAILAIWIAVSILCDAFFLRDIVARSGYHSLEFRIAFANTLSKALMLLLDEIPKYMLIKDDEIRQDVIWDRTAGFWSRILFIWLGKTFLFGFRSHAAASGKLDAEDRSAFLLAQFKHEWLQADKKSRFALLNICLSLTSWQFYLGSIARLTNIVFVSTQSFFIKAFVTYIMERHRVDYNEHTAKSIITFGAVTYSGILLSKAAYMKLNSDLQSRFRGILISVIHNKSLSLSSINTIQNTTKTLLDDKVGEIIDGLELFQLFWAHVVAILLNLGILVSLLGPMGYGVLFQTAFCITTAKYVRTRIAEAQAICNERTKERTAEVSGMLTQIKSIKMVGLNNLVADQIRKIHSKEISELISVRKWSTFHYVKTAIQSIGTPAAFLCCGLWWSNWTAIPANAFPVYLTVTLIEHPPGVLPRLWTLVVSALQSIKSVQDFLFLENTHRQHKKQHVRVAQNKRNMAPPKPQAENVVFQLRNAAVAVFRGKAPVLRNVSLTVYRGEITMILGPTSSGKSTLLRAAIGEAKIVLGQRYKRHLKTTYCGQRVWLQSRTIQQNILNDAPLDIAWYDTVIDACQLKQDFQNMPKSDQTMISGNGSNLSGGQKHRVALARALYHKPSLLVLDNAFTSLDRQTAGIIFSRVFGPRGLARQLNITVIMAAHTPQCLKFADRFIFINTAERVLERTVYAADLQALIQTVFGNSLPDDNDDNDAASKETTVDNRNGIRLQKIPLAETGQQHKKDNLERGVWKPLMFYFQSVTPLQCATAVISIALISLVEMSPGLYILLWLEQTLPSSFSFFTGYCLFWIINVAVMAWSIGIVLLQVNPASAKNFHALLVQKSLGATLQYLTQTDYISMMSLFAQDIASVTNELPMDFLRAVYSFGNMLTTVGIVVYSIPGEFYLCLLSIIALYFILRQYIRKLRHFSSLELETQAAIQQRLMETARGLELIRAFGWRQEELWKALKRLDASRAASYAVSTNTRWLTLQIDLVTFAFAMYLVVATATSFLTVTGSRVGLALTTIFAVNVEMEFFVTSYADLALSLGSAARIQDFTERTPQEIIPKKQAELPRDWPSYGKVVMSEVTATYDASNNQSVLKDVSFTITPGQKVGIVGRTGSGKTSLLMTLLNFLDYTGTITIDDIDISTIDPHVLRASVTTVSQDFIEFDNTVRFNLCPWTINATTTEEGNVNEVSAIELLQELGLWQLVTLHGGLDAKVSDLDLSQGQKQLFCVIRACLHKLASGSRLVIMDESTSDIDDGMVEAVKNAMKAAFWDCTVITVAHRSQALEDVDLIMYMSDGKIVRQKQPKAKTADPAPSPPPGMPQEPVAMTPFFEELLQKSLQAEADVAAGLYN